MKENPSDEILMRRIAEGCDTSFAELYDRYSVRMHRYFYRMLGQDANVADDFTQELFMKIIEKRALYDPGRRFSTWFYTVAGNMVKNEYRRRSRQQTPPMEPEAFTEDFTTDLDQQVFEKHLALALEQLDETLRQCFVLRYQEEMSLKEIADIQDCPEGTVKSRLFYTIKKLSGKLRTFSGGVLLS
ncbi:MAG: RNA polymerase sigma factor [Lewinellaceae bacterium]|nr:RNA polymerase sigma factor [Saprospiraceae bacterium]MCB9337026.1 RNA polymerase sigma factor [Lewinellaceae bacterium]